MAWTNSSKKNIVHKYHFIHTFLFGAIRATHMQGKHLKCWCTGKQEKKILMKNKPKSNIEFDNPKMPINIGKLR